MKLIIASIAAATVLTTTASAMVQPTQIDPRDAAQRAIGQVTTGVVSSVPTEAFVFDGRSKATIASDTVTVTSFEANERPLDSSDYR